MGDLANDTDKTSKLLDAATLERLQIIQETYADVHGFISVIVCLFGIMANIANIVVLTRKHMVSSTNVILTWLAVADLCTMIDYVPFALRFYIFKDPDLVFPKTRGYGWICYLLFHADFSITMHSISIWLTIVLAMFRFLYIFFPHKGSIYCSVRHAQVVIFIVYFSAVIVCIPNYISNYYTDLQVNGTNETIYAPKTRKNGPYHVVFDLNYWLQAMLIKLIPCFLLTVLTILLIYALHKAHKRHLQLKNQGNKADTDKHHEHIRTTGMLLAVVILFLITELPQGILTLLMIFIDTLQAEVYNPLGDILDIAALINNAINFVLYCSMSKQFRDTFVNIFCQCFTDKDARWAKLNLILSRNGGKKDNAQGTMI